MVQKFAVVAALAVSPLAFAQFVVDGTRDAGYPAALSTQTATTGFGDSNLGLVDGANGSELDNFHAAIDGGVLYLFFGGNLESNFNKFELFIDANAGGQNQIRGDNVDVDFNGLNRLGTTGIGDGLLFDPCFTSDFYVTTTCGGTPTTMYANIAQMLTLGGGTGGYIGQGLPGTVPIDSVKYGVKLAINNSNIAGVGADGGSTDGSAVETGIEIAIPLLLLGYDPSTQQNIRVCAAINGGGHDWLSNQFIAPLGLSANLAEPRLVNLALIEGNQFATIIVDANEPDCPVEPPACPSDLNGDGVTDGSDLAAVLGGWGTESGDCNGDLTTDGSDLSVVLSAWGPCV